MGVSALLVEKDDRLAEDLGRVGKLLANVPADRAWRYMVLCRTYSDRMQQALDSSRIHNVTRQMACSGAKLARTEATKCHSTLSAAQACPEWASVVANVLRLHVVLVKAFSGHFPNSSSNENSTRII